jgi:phosphate transport system permease protein
MKERIARIIFSAAATTAILAVGLICVFFFLGGVPGILKIGTAEFLLGTDWSPTDIPASYGILPMIVGSIYVTIGAVIFGVPIGLFTAVFMAFICPKPLYRILKPAVDLLAGIPSVVYGFFGIVVLVPLVRNMFNISGNNGNNILTASMLLGMMILPTIINITETSLRAVPESMYEGAVALGASHERSVFFVILPAARSGVMAAVTLGIGRAIGETMAVNMVAGNQTMLLAPYQILMGVRTLTTNIVMEMGYSEGLHREALIATGVVLFVFMLLINFLFTRLRSERKG